MDEFRKRMLEAVEDNRSDTALVKKKITEMYQKLAAELADEAMTARTGSLTAKFKHELSESMIKKVGGLWKEVEKDIKNGMIKSAERAVAVHAGALASVKPGDLTLVNRINRVFANVAHDAVKSVYNGSIYSGKSPTLSKRIWNNAAIQTGQIEQVIAEGVAKKLSAVQLADKLEAFVNPNAAMPDDWWDVYPNMPFQRKTDYNAKRLAVTSINHAHWQATLMTAKENPYIDIFHWELTPLHAIYDICDSWAAHDEGLGEGNFRIDNAPCPHPWCTCLYYADSTKTPDEIAENIGDWIKEEEEKLGLGAGLKPVVNAAVKTANYEVIGEIASEVIEKVVKPLNPDLRGTRVVLTNERRKHIIDRRGEKIFDKIAPYFTSTVENPDIVLEYKEKDLRFLRFLNDQEDEALVLALKFAEEGDPEYVQHSIMQAIYTNKNKLDEFLKKQKLYVKNIDKKQ